MAKGRIEQEIALKVTGLDDVKEIDKKIEGLTKKKAKIEVDADAGNAASKIDKIDAQIDALSKRKAELKVTAETQAAERSIQDVIDKVDKLGHGDAANLLLTTNADRIAGEIGDLILDLDRLDANDPKVEITVANIAQLTSDLDRVQAKAKEINDTPIEPGRGTNTRKGFDDIITGADQANSATANMVGNAGQDMGELVGVTGSAGVAVGQLAEYFADSAFAAKEAGQGFGQLFRTFGAAVGPIAAIGAGLAIISDVMKARGESAEVAAAAQETLNDAYTKGGSAAKNYADALNEAGKIEVQTDRNKTAEEVGGLTALYSKLAPLITNAAEGLGLFGKATQDLAPIFAQAGISTEQWAAAVVGGNQAYGTFATALGHTTLSAEDQNLVLKELADTQKENSEAKRNGAAFETVFGSAVEDTSKKVKVGDGFLKLMTDTLTEQAEAAVAAAKAQAEMATSVEDANIALLDASKASEAFAEGLDRANQASELDFSQMAFDTVDSFDSMKEAIKGAADEADGWSTVDLTPESVDELRGIPDDLQAVTEGIAGMRDSVQAELQAAFDTGGIEAYKDKAAFFAEEIKGQFVESFKAAGASEDEANAKADELLGALGLLPEQVEIQVKLTREEEARNALDAFSSVISQMPRDVQVAINTAIAEGDVEGALAILNDQLIHRGYDPIVLPVDAETAPADAAVEGWQDAADGTTGTTTLDAEDRKAKAAVDLWEANANASKAQADFDANPNEAEAAVNLWTANANAARAQAAFNATAAGAYTTLDGWEAAANATRATAKVTAQANTAQADRDLDTLTQQQRIAKITVQVVKGFFANGGIVGPNGGIAGEAGPEFVDGQLVTGPTPVTAGTRVTSVRRTRAILSRSAAHTTSTSTPASVLASVPLVVNVNAAVVGSRYEVAKAVGQGTRDLRRLIGARGIAV